ncbi:hypothetical protein M433DRAFT_131483 [Acidomyces richmondensis BFW]|nr:hypothetical protein M433DRAFT_131483 [Acidomyces richmondensis BFW]
MSLWCCCSDSSTGGHDFVNAPIDSPEGSAGRAVRLFCESGGGPNGGDEVLHLPVIVEAAESSPAAAAASAQQIRVFLTKRWSQKPYVQYNAIMLIRILSDNPGPTFTRNFDKSFVGTVKECLRHCKDSSTQQILRETLDNLEVSKGHDEGAQLLLQMWRKEKGQSASLSHPASQRYPPQGPLLQPPQLEQGYAVGPPMGWQQGAWQNGSGRDRHQLPPPVELASRIEEARNTAKILMQFIQSTPAEEVMGNDLIKEFGDRCQSAQKSMQNYINCDNPAPDDDTLQTLIETNEQLSLAGSRYQRALLAARRAMGAGSSPNPETQQNGSSVLAPPLTRNQGPTSTQPKLAENTSNGTYFQQAPSPQSQFKPPPNHSHDGYEGPPSPPPKLLHTFQQRGNQSPPASSPTSSQAPRLPAIQHNDPFADPIERDSNPAPFAVEQTNYSQPSHYAQERYQQAPPGQTFTIEPETIYGIRSAYDLAGRRNTVDLENAYSDPATPVSQPSPAMTRASPRLSEAGFYKTSSPPRPGPGPWHASGITSSYIGRQVSAADGLTMHGADAPNPISEIDSHSDVGRNEPGSAVTQGSNGDGAGSLYSSSPVEARSPQQQSRRVDIAGTGGFRDSFVGKSKR